MRGHDGEPEGEDGGGQRRRVKGGGDRRRGVAMASGATGSGESGLRLRDGEGYFRKVENIRSVTKVVHETVDDL